MRSPSAAGTACIRHEALDVLIEDVLAPGMVEDGKLQMELEGISEIFGVSVSQGVLTYCQENHGCERVRESE